MVPTLINLISALTALAAVVIGPCVLLRIARRQIGEARINALREDLSEVFEILTTVQPARLSEEEAIKYADKLSRARLLINRIRLRLDPEDKPSDALLDLIRQLFEPQMNFDQALGRAFSKSQEVLEAEGRRVKVGM